MDYRSGNLHSARKSVETVASNFRNIKVVVTSEPHVISKADKIILPGVGSFDKCQKELSKIIGLREVIGERVIQQGYPLLGICIGHQLLATYGYENDVKTPGLDWIPGEVVGVSAQNDDIKIPHMGWNSIKFTSNHALFRGIEEGSHMYFVHSYQLIPDNPKHRIAYVDYGEEITAAVVNKNIAGTQFHPEKSQGPGLKFIENFLCWRP